jgi:5'-3' exonuclease
MLSPSAPKKLFLLDAFALIYRAYFAFAKNPRPFKQLPKNSSDFISNTLRLFASNSSAELS